MTLTRKVAAALACLILGAHGAFAAGESSSNPYSSWPLTVLSAATNNSQTLVAGPATLMSVTWLNTTATLMDIRFYDSATAPTCSSATGMVANFVAQANTTSPGGSPYLGATGLKFINGISICITGANSNTDNSNATTGLNLIIGYQP